MKKISLIFSLVLILGLITVLPVFAKRLLPRFQTTAKTRTQSGTRGITTSVKFRGDRLAIVVTFSNLAIATKVNYFLSYNTRGTTQGASGSIADLSIDPIARELLFGNCSKGACRYDTGITNAKFVVTTYLPNGKRVIKTFRLKI